MAKKKKKEVIRTPDDLEETLASEGAKETEAEAETEVKEEAPAEKPEAKAEAKAPPPQPVSEKPVFVLAPREICQAGHKLNLASKEVLNSLVAKKDPATVGRLQAVVNAVHAATGRGCPVCAGLVRDDEVWPQTKEEVETLLKAKAKREEKTRKAAARAARPEPAPAQKPAEKPEPAPAEPAKEVPKNEKSVVLSRITELLPKKQATQLVALPSGIKVRKANLVRTLLFYGEKGLPTESYSVRKKKALDPRWSGVACVDCGKSFSSTQARDAYVQYGTYRCNLCWIVWQKAMAEKVLVPTASGRQRQTTRFDAELYRLINVYRQAAGLPIVPELSFAEEAERELKAQGIEIPALEAVHSETGERYFKDEMDREAAIKACFYAKDRRNFRFLPPSLRPKAQAKAVASADPLLKSLGVGKTEAERKKKTRKPAPAPASVAREQRHEPSAREQQLEAEINKLRRELQARAAQPAPQPAPAQKPAAGDIWAQLDRDLAALEEVIGNGR